MVPRTFLPPYYGHSGIPLALEDCPTEAPLPDVHTTPGLSPRPHPRLPDEGGHPTSTTPTLLPIPRVHRPSEGWGNPEDHHRSLLPERQHPRPVLHHRQPCQGSTPHGSSSVHGLPGHQGGVHTHPHTPQPTQIPGVFLPRRPLFLPSSTFWPQLRAIRLHQGLGVAPPSSPQFGYPGDCIPGRPPPMASKPPGPHTPSPHYHSLPPGDGVPDSPHEITPPSGTHSHLARHTVVRPDGPLVGPTSLSGGNTKDGPSTRLGHLHHETPLGNSGREDQLRLPDSHPPPCPPPTLSPSLSHSTSLCQGYTRSSSSCSPRATTHMDVPHTLGDYASVPASFSDGPSLDRRVSPRLGGSPGLPRHGEGILVRGRTNPPHQYPRATSHPTSTATFPTPQQASNCLHRQRGGSPCTPRPSSPLPHSPQGIHRPPSLVSSPQPSPVRHKSPVSAQCGGRRTQQARPTGHRVASPHGFVPRHHQLGGSPRSGFVRHPTQLPSSKIHYSFSPSTRLGHQRSRHRLAKLRQLLRLPTRQPHSPTHSSSPPFSREGSPGRPLATTGHVVPSTPPPLQSSSSPTHDSLPRLPERPGPPLIRALRSLDRISFLRHILQSSRPPTVVNSLLAAYRRSSNRQHEVAWRAFQHWLPPQTSSISVEVILSFLQHLFDQKRLAPHTIHCYFLSLKWPLQRAFAVDCQHPDIARILKGFFHLRPPPPPKIPSWDLLEVLLFYSSLRLPLPSKVIFLKTLFLVALASGNRVSELAALHRPGIIHNNTGVIIPLRPSFLFKNQTARRTPPPVSFPSFSSSPLCPVFYLRHYVDWTTPTDSTDALFLHPTSHKALDTSRLRYWMVQAIRLAQTHRPIVRPHEVRKLAYSANWSRRTDLPTLLQHGFWASSHPFLSNYLVNLPDALPHFIAAGASV